MECRKSGVTVTVVGLANQDINENFFFHPDIVNPAYLQKFLTKRTGEALLAIFNMPINRGGSTGTLFQD